MEALADNSSGVALIGRIRLASANICSLTVRSSRHRSAGRPRRQVELATWPTPLHDAA